MSTNVEPTGQPFSPTEPEDRSIVAWYNAAGVVSRVFTRMDEWAALGDVAHPDHWYEADDRSDGICFVWPDLCKEMRDLYGPVLLKNAGPVR